MREPTLGAFGARLLADAQLREGAARFFQAASRAAIPAAPIKGLAMSAALYEDPLERPFGDVDVLVGSADLARVESLARREGFGLIYDSKQLGTVNVVIPPGIPIDVRTSIGPPGFCALSGRTVLARATARTDPRVCAAPIQWLHGHDHIMMLAVDALMDKLVSRPELRSQDLRRALAKWVDEPAALARHAQRAQLSVVTAMVLGRFAGDDPIAREVSDCLHPLPAFAARVATWLTSGDTLRGRPHGAISRVGVRFVCDEPARGVLALALGAIGTARFHARHGRRSPWNGEVWKGPGA